MHSLWKFLAAPLAILLLLVGTAAAQFFPPDGFPSSPPSGPPTIAVTATPLIVKVGETVGVHVSITNPGPFSPMVTNGDGFMVPHPVSIGMNGNEGDGSTSYSRPGAYIITALLGSAISQVTVTVVAADADPQPQAEPPQEAEPPAPALTFGALGDPLYAGEEITFTVMATGLPDGDDVTIDFGDGSATATTAIGAGTASTTHSFAAPGIYSVTATKAGVPTATATVTIGAAPSRGISVSITPITAPSTVSQPVTYLVNVTNPGDVTYPGGELEVWTDQYRIFSMGEGCAPLGKTSTCPLPALVHGGTSAFYFTVLPEGPGAASFTASAAWPDDTNPEDNSATADATIASDAPVDPTPVALDITDQLRARASVLLGNTTAVESRIARLNGALTTVTPSALVSAFMPATAGGPIHLAGRLGAIDAATAPGATGPNLWFDATFGALGGTSDGNFSIARLGIDQLITPDLLAGLSLSLDRSDVASGGATLSGTGWLLSPYLTARLAPNFYIDLSAGAGLSHNSLGDVEFAGHRLSASGALIGEWSDGPWTFSPELRFAYLLESTDAADGVAAATVETGRLAAGPTLAYRFSLDEVAAEARLGANAYLEGAGDGANADIALRAGLGLALPGGASLDLDLTATGLTDASTGTIALRAGLSGTLP
jgi:hypothetical protein